MRCFKACFVCSSSPSGKPVRAPVGATASKDKINGHSETLETLLSKYSDQELLGGKSIKPTPESKEEEVEEEEVRCPRMKKKVTFDLPAVYKAPEEVTATASDVESGDGTRIDLRKSAEKVEECEDLSSESVFQDEGLLAMQDESSEEVRMKKKVTFELPAVYKAPEEVTATASDVENGDRTRMDLQTSAETVEECENLSSESVFQDKGLLAMQDESSESLFSLSIDSRKQQYGAEVDDEKEVTSVQRSEFNAASALDKSSPLICIENLPQLRSVKAGFELRCDEDEKENRDEHQQVAVDASLSSWLVIKSKTTPPSSSPPTPTSSLSGDRPILGAAETKEKKMQQCSYGSNSRRQRLVEMPLLGTVGSYWTHTGRIIVD